MATPEEVLTKDGYRKYQAHLHNMDEALFFLLGHDDVLEFSEENHEKMLQMQMQVTRWINE